MNTDVIDPIALPIPNQRLSEHLGQVLRRQDDQVRAADAKAGAIIALSLAVIGWILASGRGLPASLWILDWRGALFGVSLVAAGAAGILCVAAVLPRAWAPQTTGSLFWGDVLAHGSPGDFWAHLQRQTDESLTRQMTDEVYVLARILDRKFRLVRVAGWLALSAGVLAACAAVLARMR